MEKVVQNILIYLPISLIGLWRWSMWVTRKIGASFYRPERMTWPKDKPLPKVTVVTPVYNEEPELFDKAVRSWIEAGADEIVAVIDKENTAQIIDYQRRFVDGKHRADCRLVVTPRQGKRAALCDGIEASTGDIVALVDSDTIWSKNVLEESIPNFLDREVGGVTITQRVYKPTKLAHILFDILLWTRYKEEVPFLLGVGSVFNTLSGRTAIYRREALLNPEHDNLHDLRHEFFFKTRGVSGDDKRLTHLILEQGWLVAYAPNATVYTPGTDSLKTFLKQRLRWTRNSWRADSRAFKRGWIFRHPALAFYNFDRFIQPFFMLVGPVAFVLFLAAEQWLPAALIFVWWMTSRFIRLFGYFRTYPSRLVYLPAYLLFTYITALIKIYAWATLLEHNWATRWHTYRMRTKNMFKRYSTVSMGVSAMVASIAGVAWFVDYLQTSAGYNVKVEDRVVTASAATALGTSDDSPSVPSIPENAIRPKEVHRYVIQPGDTLSELSARWGISERRIRITNDLEDPDELTAGETLYYYERTQETE